jgi:hypothetical protein
MSAEYRLWKHDGTLRSIIKHNTDENGCLSINFEGIEHYHKIKREEILKELALECKELRIRIKQREALILEQREEKEKEEKRLQKKIEFLKLHLDYKQKIDDPRFKTRWTTSHSVQIDENEFWKSADENQNEYITNGYISLSIETKINKKDIKEAIENKKEIPGASIVQNQSLSIS